MNIAINKKKHVSQKSEMFAFKENIEDNVYCY